MQPSRPYGNKQMVREGRLGKKWTFWFVRVCGQALPMHTQVTWQAAGQSKGNMESRRDVKLMWQVISLYVSGGYHGGNLGMLF